MYNFISGAIMLGCWIISLYFLKFYKKSQDRLFQIFSLAFFVLGVERILPVFLVIDEKPKTFTYIIRLIAFILILAGIVHKNRHQKAN
jgi:hypothetical protein